MIFCETEMSNIKLIGVVYSKEFRNLIPLKLNSTKSDYSMSIANDPNYAAWFRY